MKNYNEKAFQDERYLKNTNFRKKVSLDQKRFQKDGGFRSLQDTKESLGFLELKNGEYCNAETKKKVEKAIPEGINPQTNYFVVTGWGNVYEVEDRADDVVKKGAFGKDLKENGNTRPCLYNHDIEHFLPIGVNVVVEKPQGLWVETYIEMPSEDDIFTQNLIKNIKNKNIKAYSIGFMTTKCTYEEEGETSDWIRNIEEAVLFEVSLVLFPCNELAIIEDFEETESQKSFYDMLVKALPMLEKLENNKELKELLESKSTSIEIPKLDFEKYIDVKGVI